MSQKNNGRRIRRRVIGITASAFLVLALFAPNAGAGAGTIRETISGAATISDCNGSEGVGGLAFEGDLDGCLSFNPRFYECTELNGFALFEERGTEIFRGTYKDKRGVFRTFYTLAATYEQGSCASFDAGNPPYGSQLTGGCDHAINGTRGVFQGLTGNFNIFDLIDEPGTSGATSFLWAGYIG